MRIYYSDGSVHEVAILSLVGGVMRVAVQGYDDPLELELVNGMWLSDGREPVSFEFPLGCQQAQNYLLVVQQTSAVMQSLWN